MSIIIPVSQTLDAPIIEDGRTAITSAETFRVHSSFAKFLTTIDHNRIRIHGSGDNHARNTRTSIPRKEIRSDTLFIVILQEIQHIFLDSLQRLPTMRYITSRSLSAHHRTNRIIKTNLVIQIIKVSRINIIPILIRIIHLRYKDHITHLLHLRNHPVPKLYRDHLSHITTKTIHPLISPEQQDLQHFLPRIGNGIEMASTTVHIIHAVVQLHRLIPIVLAWIGIEMIVTGHLRRKLTIGKILLTLRIKTKRQGLSRKIIKVIIHIKSLGHIIRLT